MNPIAKVLIFLGITFLILGLLWQVGGKFFSFGKLPGDWVIEKENVKIYIPIVSCIVLSLILSLVAYLFRLFR